MTYIYQNIVNLAKGLFLVKRFLVLRKCAIDKSTVQLLLSDLSQFPSIPAYISGTYSLILRETSF